MIQYFDDLSDFHQWRWVAKPALDAAAVERAPRARLAFLPMTVGRIDRQYRASNWRLSELLPRNLSALGYPM